MVDKFSKNLEATFELYVSEMWPVSSTPKTSKYYVLPPKNLVARHAEFTLPCLTLYNRCIATQQFR